MKLIKITGKIKYIAVLLLSCGFLVYFALKLDFNQLFRVLGTASIPWILVGVILFAVQIFFGMLRFRLLLGISSGLQWKMYGLQSAYSVIKYVLPGLFGEVSIVYLFKKSLQVEYSNSSNALFVVRIFDALFLIVVFISGYIFFFKRLLSQSIYLQPIMNIMVILALACLGLILLMTVGGQLVLKGLGMSIFQNNRWGKWFSDFVGELLAHFKAVLSLRTIVKLSGLTLLMWFFFYLVMLVSVRAIGMNITALEIFFVFLIVFPLQFLPVRGPGNFGSHELSWVVALSLLGFNRQSSVLIAFGTHGIYIILILVFFLFVIGVFGKKTFLMMKQLGEGANT